MDNNSESNLDEHRPHESTTTQTTLTEVENNSELNLEQNNTPHESTNTQTTLTVDEKNYIDDTYPDSELMLGLVTPTGTDISLVTYLLTERLATFKYEAKTIKISTEIIPNFGDNQPTFQTYFERVNYLMTRGNELRQQSNDNSILALAAAAQINAYRNNSAPLKRKAFLISTLKHPDEVHRLRKIYPSGFYLIGIHADQERRFNFLTQDKSLEKDQANILMERDADESEHYGQHTRDTFHLSDFFISFDGHLDKLKNDIWRIVDIIFGKPYITPTFDEYAMFMAYSASLRSADLSRQVGAVIAKDNNIISTGTNDIPKAGGGLYWPEYNSDTHAFEDAENGRDYKRGADSNFIEIQKLITNALNQDVLNELTEDQKNKLIKHIHDSKIKDITEYGRVVHAEMESILACARNHISTQDTTLYCTTFPCHNCAKHIISAGLKRVVYVEPYTKSKAFEFHVDAISTSEKSVNKVLFQPFVGVGPRSFFNLFSMKLGSGYPMIRKNKKDGKIIDWSESSARLRLQMLPCSYIDREVLASKLVDEYLERINGKQE